MQFAAAELQGPHPPSDRNSLPGLGSTPIRDAEELPLWKDTGVAERRRFRVGPNRGMRTLFLAAAFFLAACSGPATTSALRPTGHRLHSAESLCGGKALLNPPTSTEHPRVSAPRIKKSEVHVRFVGPPPLPHIVYARITLTDTPDFNNTPAWVVIYRNAKIIVGTGAIGKVGRPVAHETVLLLFDPTSGSGSDVQACRAGV